MPASATGAALSWNLRRSSACGARRSRCRSAMSPGRLRGGTPRSGKLPAGHAAVLRHCPARDRASWRDGGEIPRRCGDGRLRCPGAARGRRATGGTRGCRAGRGALAAPHPTRGEFGTTVSVRIGVNTGHVVVGTEERLATGDAVNPAARLEQAAGPGEIVIGHQTWRLVRDAVTAEPLKPRRRVARALITAQDRGYLPTRKTASPHLDIMLVRIMALNWSPVTESNRRPSPYHRVPIGAPARAFCERPDQRLYFSPVGTGSGQFAPDATSQIPPNRHGGGVHAPPRFRPAGPPFDTHCLRAG